MHQKVAVTFGLVLASCSPLWAQSANSRLSKSGDPQSRLESSNPAERMAAVEALVVADQARRAAAQPAIAEAESRAIAARQAADGIVQSGGQVQISKEDLARTREQSHVRQVAIGEAEAARHPSAISKLTVTEQVAAQEERRRAYERAAPGIAAAQAAAKADRPSPSQIPLP